MSASHDHNNENGSEPQKNIVTEQSKKSNNIPKIIIGMLVVVVLILVGALFFVILKNNATDKNDKAPDVQSSENTATSPSMENVAPPAVVPSESTDSTTGTPVTTPSDISSEATQVKKYPDLYIEKYEFNEDPIMGEEFTVKVKIGNKGTANAEDFHWAWYATTNDKECEGKVDSLAVGETIKVECTYTYAGWSLYTTQVVVDSKSEIYESNESNNTATKQITPIHDTAKADLYINEYKFNHPPKSGEAFTVSISIYNQGNAASGSFWWEWWPTSFGKACRVKVDNIVAHGGKTVTCTYTYASWSTYETKAVADADNDVAESNESNNEYS
ncbi:MAG: CARDB domain-containing protein [Parcubacteria group bacterium]|jgi:hypothetical protein